MSEITHDEVRGVSIDALPNELLLDIADFLDARGDFFSLVVTSRRFHSLFEKKLYVMDSSLAFRDYKSLDWAASTGDLVVARKLLDYGCDLHATFDGSESDDSLTAVNLAMRSGSLAMITLLVAAGVSADLAPEEDDVPILVALREGWTNIFEVLVCLGKARLDIVDRSTGYGLLTFAAYFDNMEAIRRLISAHPRCTDSERGVSSPFHQAIHNENYELFIVLLEKTRCSPTLPAENRITPLEMASEWGMVTFVHALLEDGRATKNYDETGNRNAVLRAFHNKHYGTVELLLVHRNRCRPHASVFTGACKLKMGFIAWRAFQFLNAPNATLLEWRRCARNNGLFDLANRMTELYDMDLMYE